MGKAFLKGLFWILVAICIDPTYEIRVFRGERKAGYSICGHIFWTAYHIDSKLVIADIRSVIGLKVTNLIIMTSQGR